MSKWKGCLILSEVEGSGPNLGCGPILSRVLSEVEGRRMSMLSLSRPRASMQSASHSHGAAPHHEEPPQGGVSNDDYAQAEDGWAWLKLLLQALPQVVEQMNAIRHLPGLGSPLPSSFGVKAVAVTADDLHFGMPAQPTGDALGSAIREHVPHTPGIQGNEDCPEHVT